MRIRKSIIKTNLEVIRLHSKSVLCEIPCSIYPKNSIRGDISGYVGHPDPGFNPTTLGALLFNAQEYHKKMPKSDIPKKRYIHRYPRTDTTYNKTLKAVEIMRYTYRYSMNNIALGLQISTRTVKKRLKDLYKMGFKIFHCMRNRLYRSKNPSMMRMLRRVSAQIKRYINGHLTLLELYLALGIKPPPSEDGAYSSLF